MVVQAGLHIRPTRTILQYLAVHGWICQHAIQNTNESAYEYTCPSREQAYSGLAVFLPQLLPVSGCARQEPSASWDCQMLMLPRRKPYSVRQTEFLIYVV
jgi:hypothetical protein